MSARIPLLQVDAFTAEALRGNPAAVCLLNDRTPAPEPAWMQAVAAEMNLSETAFVRRRPPGPGGAAEFDLRWFTPAVEVPLCGHATLASAHVLWSEGVVAPATPLAFHSASGLLTARREGDWIGLDFPAYTPKPLAAPEGLAAALGAEPVGVYRDELGYWLAEFDSAARVRALRPDFARFQAAGVASCTVTAAGDTPECDFVSRFFAPGFGIDEDPVTGSAHCGLGPFWAARLRCNDLTGHQVSKRGGVVKVRVRGGRVELLGQAVTVLRGELLA